MKSTWVIVADSSRGRIFTSAGGSGRLRELADLSHAEARLHARDLTSDLPGRAFDSHGRGRHAMEARAEPKEQAARDFAAELCRRIEAARIEGEFDSLVLVAPPKFLGYLRAGVAKAAHDAVAAELDKNLVNAAREDIESHLAASLSRPMD